MPFLLLGAISATLAAGLIALGAERLFDQPLALQPALSPAHAYRLDAPSVATMSGSIALVGGFLLYLCVRPAKPRFLWRSAAGQAATSSCGLLAVLAAPLTTELTLVAVAAATAFLPAAWLGRLARGTFAEYRKIPRRPE